MGVIVGRHARHCGPTRGGRGRWRTVVSALAIPAVTMWAPPAFATPAASAVTAPAATDTSAATFATATVATSGPASPAPDPAAWTVYHQSPAGTGVATSVARVDTGEPAWTSPELDGEVYGEPLVSSGRVYVATESDTVYALSSSTGAVLWSTHVGEPVPSGALPCGNITPVVGITGTPVVDQARGEIFVVADELVHGHPAHVLVGLGVTSGRTEMTRDVDPAGSTPAALLQRTGLTLDGGQVVFGFGGNYGDCSTYRGWVVAVDEAGGTPVDFAVDDGPGESQGAIWMGGGAPAVDSAGNLWVGVGNGSVESSRHAYDYSDSVLELSSTLHLLQYFAPTTWASDNARDLDVSTEPALLPDGQVVEASKAQIAYLLDSAHLGGIGGQQATLESVCGNDMDGGTAVVGSTVYLSCLTGVVALQATSSPAGLRVRWTSPSGGGPPIVAAGRVWTIGLDGTLYGLDPTTGSVLQRTSIGTPANHFPTPSVGDGVLLAASADRVVAFTASPVHGTGPSSTTGGATPSTVIPRHPRPVPATEQGGGLPAGAIAGIVAGAIVIVGAAAWLLWRRRQRPAGS